MKFQSEPVRHTAPKGEFVSEVFEVEIWNPKTEKWEAAWAAIRDKPFKVRISRGLPE